MATTLSTQELLLSIHGIELRFVTNSPALAGAASALLRHFTRPGIGDHPATLSFTAVARREEIPLQVSTGAKQLYKGSGIALPQDQKTTWLCDVSAEGTVLFADFHDEGLIVIDGAAQTAQGFLVQPEKMSPDTRASFVHFAMTELLKRCGLFTFHATALEKDGLGVLIPGFSGRGKTTSFLSLLRAGYRYVSDDHPFYRLHGSGVEMLPYPLKINVTDRTVQFFPELRDAPPSVLRPGIPKRYFHVEDIYPGPLGQPCPPAMILFPQVHQASFSCLEPLSKKQAMELILPHALLVFDAAVARREFQALARLVEQADCYRLHFGQDVLDLPRLVTPLLDQRRMRAEN